MIKYFTNKRKKGQSTLEYAILIIIIIGALVSIQVYIKRGVSGRLKSAADDIGDQFSSGNTNVIRRTTVTSYTTETYLRGVSRSTLKNEEQTIDTLDQNISNINYEYWGG